MASYLNDIEEFTIDELRSEILRRETAAREGRCWYCKANMAAHTCKYADPKSPVPGWEVKPPRFVDDEDCMGQKCEYWQVTAKHTVVGCYVIGNGKTAKEATEKCLHNISQKQL